MKYPGENGIHVPQLQFRIDHGTNFFLSQDFGYVGIFLQCQEEVLISIPDLHGAALNPAICILARYSFPGKIQQ